MINANALQLQQDAINTVIEKLKLKDEIVFKAPTGSGKTIMIAQIMDKWLSTNPDTIFIVTTLAKSELGVQNHKSFIEWSTKLNNIKPYNIDTDNLTTETGLVIPKEFNVYSLTDALFKKNSKISNGPLFQFLLYLKQNNKKIIWIKDECHKAFNNFDELYESKKYPFIKKINVSATPQSSKFPIIDCEITEESAENAKLIKKLVGKRGFGLSQGAGNSYFDDQYVELKEALEKLKNLRKSYMEMFSIRPCMIIQIPSKSKDPIRSGDEELKHLIKLLNQKNSDGDFYFNWIYICDDVSEYQTNTNLGNEAKLKKNTWKTVWKEEAKKNNSSIDIVIFKMVITEGWDIKRANMLFQIRDPNSETLTEQVIGRIRRNPILLDWEKYDEKAHELALQAFVWGDLKDVNRQFKRVKLVDSQNKIFIQTTLLKNIKKIYEDKQINLDSLIGKWSIPDEKKNIFELYKEWNKADDDTKKMLYENIEFYSDWFKISYNMDKIVTENKRLFETYQDSIILGKKELLPDETYFEVIKDPERDLGPLTIKTKQDKFTWKIISESLDEKYFFDSESEKKFADEMKYFKKDLWARNFYPNSKISFEYINIGKHKSYPDFILLDSKGVYHIFEVKSFDNSYHETFDTQEYKNKVYALQRFYKEVTNILKNYVFYIPIHFKDRWNIYMYTNGEETEITLDQLKNIFEE